MRSSARSRSSEPARRPFALRFARPGTFYGWWIVFACMVLTTINSGVGFYGLATLLRPIREEHGWTNAQVSMASFVFYLAVGVLTMFTGPWIDRIGPMPFLLSGCVVMGTAIASIGLVGSLWQLYAAYTFMAVGQSLMSLVAINALIARWFVRLRGRAMGIAALGNSAGGIVAPPVISVLITTNGLSVASMLMGLLLIVVSVPTVALVLTSTPESVGQHIDGADAPPPVSTLAADTAVWSTRQAVRSPVFWMFPAVFVVAFISSNGFVIHQLAYLQEKLGSRDQASFALSAMALASTLARMVVAAIVDRVNRRLLLAGMLLAQAGAVYTVTFVDGRLALFACVAVFGFTLGNMFLIQTLLAVDSFGAASFGRVFGMLTLFNQVAFGFGPLLVGWLEDRTGSYLMPFRVTATGTTAAALLLFALHRLGRPVPFPDESEPLSAEPALA